MALVCIGQEEWRSILLYQRHTSTSCIQLRRTVDTETGCIPVHTIMMWATTVAVAAGGSRIAVAGNPSCCCKVKQIYWFTIRRDGMTNTLPLTFFSFISFPFPAPPLTHSSSLTASVCLASAQSEYSPFWTRRWYRRRFSREFEAIN